MKFEDFAGVFVAAFAGTLLAFLVALYGFSFAIESKFKGWVGDATRSQTPTVLNYPQGR